MPSRAGKMASNQYRYCGMKHSAPLQHSNYKFILFTLLFFFILKLMTCFGSKPTEYGYDNWRQPPNNSRRQQTITQQKFTYLQYLQTLPRKTCRRHRSQELSTILFWYLHIAKQCKTDIVISHGRRSGRGLGPVSCHLASGSELFVLRVIKAKQSA